MAIITRVKRETKISKLRYVFKGEDSEAKFKVKDISNCSLKINMREGEERNKIKERKG